MFRLIGLGLRALLALVPALSVAIGVFALGLYQTYRDGLPVVDDASQYDPPAITRFVAADGSIIGEFAEQRRIVVPYRRIPRQLIQAFLAAEDTAFFEHDGIDPKGVVRAALINLRAGRVRQGASTITQQLAKQMLVRKIGYAKGTERGLGRKIREAILARRLEYTLSKEDILYLYLNEIYLGAGVYGVQAAAESYFAKNVEDLTLGEMSLLAGLPPAPSRYSPIKNPKAARTKQAYVLRRMVEEGYISVDEMKAAKAERAEQNVQSKENLFADVAPYFTEHVRRDLVEEFGEEVVLKKGGWLIETTIDVSRQRAARGALKGGLDRLDRRMGYWGPIDRVAPGQISAAAKAYQELKLGSDSPKVNGEYIAVVESVSRRFATVLIGSKRYPVLLKEHRWMRTARRNALSKSDYPADMSKVLNPGDMLRVVVREEKGKTVARIIQDPMVEGALVSQDIETDYVVAMVGGYDFDRSQFNRAFQACRQPGSSFKPIIFSAGLEHGGKIRRNAPHEVITPSTLLSDTPIVRHDWDTGVRWKPNNYDSSYSMDVPLRTALMRSMNLPTIDLFERVGAQKVVEWAGTLGIKQKLHVDASIALGSHCVIPWELIQVYSLFARQGRTPRSRFITRITDADGTVLRDQADYRDVWASRADRVDRLVREVDGLTEPTISPALSYVMTYLLQQVVERGTATRARIDGVPVAGKTGTTNDSYDAWFVGYTPRLVSGVWVGFDHNERPLGRSETGGRTAAPIWRDYTKRAIADLERARFRVPAGVEFADIDPKTGDVGKGVRVPFIQGTVPKARQRAPQQSESVGLSDEL
ncbi:MAG: PBP1A family penicillin-binding protein [Myxococcota bacterium]|nr:PBP1A family penicillin-binding protein [Myxococcota bacterium]